MYVNGLWKSNGCVTKNLLLFIQIPPSISISWNVVFKISLGWKEWRVGKKVDEAHFNIKNLTKRDNLHGFWTKIFQAWSFWCLFTYEILDLQYYLLSKLNKFIYWKFFFEKLHPLCASYVKRGAIFDNFLLA